MLLPHDVTAQLWRSTYKCRKSNLHLYVKTSKSPNDVTPQLWRSTYKYRKHSLCYVSMVLQPLGDYKTTCNDMPREFSRSYDSLVILKQ